MIQPKNTREHIGSHKTIKIRSLKNYSALDFLTKLRNTNWANVTECNNVNDAWSKFKQIFTNILDEIAPIKQIRIKVRTEPWMNNELLELINERDKTLTLSNKDKGNTLLREKFNMLRNKVQREVKKVKSSYFHNKIK